MLASQAAISLENSRLYRDLADREAKIRRLVDANILGICIWNLEGGIVEANDEFLRMLQYDRDDVVSGRLRWTDLTPAEWREQDERAVAELRSTGTFQPFEKEFFRKDGSRVPVLIGGALFEEGGNEGVAFVLDLTERKRAENALRESEERFRDYAETASDWLWEIGTGPQIDDADRECIRVQTRRRDLALRPGITPSTLKPSRRSGGAFRATHGFAQAVPRLRISAPPAVTAPRCT